MEYYQYCYLLAVTLLSYSGIQSAAKWWKEASYRRAQKEFVSRRSHRSTAGAHKHTSQNTPVKTPVNRSVNSLRLVHRTPNRLGNTDESEQGSTYIADALRNANYTPFTPQSHTKPNFVSSPAQALDRPNGDTPTLFKQPSMVNSFNSTVQDINSIHATSGSAFKSTKAFYSKPLLPGLGVDSPFNSGPAKANLQKDTIRQREASRPMARSFFTPLPKSKVQREATPVTFSSKKSFFERISQNPNPLTSMEQSQDTLDVLKPSMLNDLDQYAQIDEDTAMSVAQGASAQGQRKRLVLLGEKEFRQQQAEALRAQKVEKEAATQTSTSVRIEKSGKNETRKVAKMRKPHRSNQDINLPPQQRPTVLSMDDSIEYQNSEDVAMEESEFSSNNTKRSARKPGPDSLRKELLRAQHAMRESEHVASLVDDIPVSSISSQPSLSVTPLKSALKKHSKYDRSMPATSVTASGSSKRKASFGLFEHDDAPAYDSLHIPETELRAEDGWITPATRRAEKRLKMDGSSPFTSTTVLPIPSPRPPPVPIRSSVTNDSGRIYLNLKKKEQIPILAALNRPFKGILDDEDADERAIQLVRESRARLNRSTPPNGLSSSSEHSAVATSETTTSSFKPTSDLPISQPTESEKLVDSTVDAPKPSPFKSTVPVTPSLISAPVAVEHSFSPPKTKVSQTAGSGLSISDRLGKRAPTSPTADKPAAPLFNALPFSTTSAVTIAAGPTAFISPSPLFSTSTSAATTATVTTQSMFAFKAPIVAPSSVTNPFSPAVSLAPQPSLPVSMATTAGDAVSAPSVAALQETKQLFGSTSAVSSSFGSTSAIPATTTTSVAITHGSTPLLGAQVTSVSTSSISLSTPVPVIPEFGATSSVAHSATASTMPFPATGPPSFLFSGIGTTKSESQTTTAPLFGGSNVFNSTAPASTQAPPMFGGLVNNGAYTPAAPLSTAGSQSTTLSTTNIFGNNQTSIATVVPTAATVAPTLSFSFAATSASTSMTTAAAPISGGFGSTSLAPAPVVASTPPLFGASSASGGFGSATSATPAFLSFGTATSTATPAAFSSFGAATSATTTAAFPIFGAATSATTPAAFPIFGAATTTPMMPAGFNGSQSTPPSLFGGSSIASAFPAPAANNSSQPAQPAFGGFGTTLATPAFQMSTATTIASMGGSSAPLAFGQSQPTSQPSISFSFGSAPPSFGQSQSNPSGQGMFGSTASGFAPPSHAFGQSQSSQQPSNSANMLGNASQPFGSSTPMFGQSQQQPPMFGSAPSSTFGQTTASQPPMFGQSQQQPPMFGQLQQQQSNSAPVFNFSTPGAASTNQGMSNPSAPAANGFSFGMPTGQAVPVFATSGASGTGLPQGRKLAQPKTRKSVSRR
ncbi:hypothetical protein QVD99_005296 [Batrachochytrium dendrobatidis]|nr:hypothetical protein O5D80_004369 [Batrachochytrium dendrobatidis]KAK5668260.1 hypothetical protein QVD99_005296 [Batrachochytrium dendrobatidis]